MKALALVFALTFTQVSFAKKAIPNESLLTLLQEKMSRVLNDVRVTSSTTFNPVSVCGGEEKVHYVLHLQVRKKVRIGASEFKDSWETVKVYYVPEEEVYGKEFDELSDVKLFDPEQCAGA